MSRLTQYSPFSSEPFADVFQAFLRPIRQNGEDQAPRMDIDVTDAGDKYVLKADVPGIDKKDITVQIDGNTVMISANKEKRTETKEAGNVIRQERFWGQVQRSVSLASPIDEAAAKAVCENGVLTLTLPKSAGSRNKTLQIE